MPDIIFARPEHDYDSYSDLWRIVELSGFPIIRIGEIDATSDNVYIFSTPSTHWHDGVERRGWPDARARIVYYNIEWYTDQAYKDIPGVEIWSTDKWHADHIGAKYVPMGSHPDLPNEGLQNCPKLYDVSLLAYLPPRRERIMHELAQVGVSAAPRGWGLERHAILQQTRIMLHVHQNDGVNTVAPQRWALAAAYKLPIISETLADGGIFGHTHGLYSDYAHIAEFCKMWRYDARLNDYALALHELLCHQLTFRKSVEAAL